MFWWKNWTNNFFENLPLCIGPEIFLANHAGKICGQKTINQRSVQFPIRREKRGKIVALKNSKIKKML
jgi:hypothetical protein